VSLPAAVVSSVLLEARDGSAARNNSTPASPCAAARKAGSQRRQYTPLPGAAGANNGLPSLLVPGTGTGTGTCTTGPGMQAPTTNAVVLPALSRVGCKTACARGRTICTDVEVAAARTARQWASWQRAAEHCRLRNCRATMMRPVIMLHTTATPHAGGRAGPTGTDARRQRVLVSYSVNHGARRCCTDCRGDCAPLKQRAHTRNGSSSSRVRDHIARPACSRARCRRAGVPASYIERHGITIAVRPCVPLCGAEQWRLRRL